MNSKLALLFIFLFFIFGCFEIRAQSTITVKDVLLPLPHGSVKLQGYMGGRLDNIIKNRLLKQDIEVILQPYRDRKDVGAWRGEFWGKWFTGLSLASDYVPDNQLVKEKMNQAVIGILSTRTPDDYIGCHEGVNRFKDWDVWSRKYTILGLLSYEAITGDSDVLNAAKRLADMTIADIGPGKRSIIELGLYRGMPSSSILEPMILLYQRTHEQRYLDFCQYIVEEWTKQGGPDLVRKSLDGIPVAARGVNKNNWWSRENGIKAYEMISCYEGLTHLYRSTGEKELLKACGNVYNDIRDNEMMVIGTGSAKECWNNGRIHQLENMENPCESCTAILWIKYARQLLGLTGDPLIMDEIERSSYNALLGSVSSDGSWCVRHSSLQGTRTAGENQCKVPLNCCVVNYPRALFLLPEIAVMKDANGPVVNFYGESNATVLMPDGNSVIVNQKTDYPVSGKILLSIESKQPEIFTLSLRIPQWSSQTILKINGKEFHDFKHGTYARLKRKWCKGDVVTLTLDMTARVNALVGNDNSRHISIVRGPIVLSRDKRFGDNIDSPVQIKLNADNSVNLKPSKSENIWMSWKVPTTDGSYLTLCDYCSAGNTWSEESRYRVWIPTDK